MTAKEHLSKAQQVGWYYGHEQQQQQQKRREQMCFSYAFYENEGGREPPLVGTARFPDGFPIVLDFLKPQHYIMAGATI